MLGRKPSFKLLSNRRISSTEVAFAMASLTLLASSLVKSRPAFPGATTERGSSAPATFFFAPVDTVVDNVVAREFMSPSAVKNKPLAACLSLSRILWKSKTLSPGNLQVSHSRYHFFSLTGFPSRLKYLSPLTVLRGSRSPNSVILLFVRTRVVRFGAERCNEGEMVDIRLLAKRSVCNRLKRGRLLSATRELSVRSMASCWSYGECVHGKVLKRIGITYTHLGHTKIFDCGDFVTAKVELTLFDGIERRWSLNK